MSHEEQNSYFSPSFSPFGEIIESHLADKRFISRTWLLERVTAFVADPKARFLLITGEPGCGKTSLIAHLASLNPSWITYFLRRGQARGLFDIDTKSYLLHVGSQLALKRPEWFDLNKIKATVKMHVKENRGELIGLDVARLIASPFAQLSLDLNIEVNRNEQRVIGIRAAEMVTDPRLASLSDLQYLALFGPARTGSLIEPDTPLVLAIDGLDEARFRRPKHNLLDWLVNSMQMMPANLRFILTSRPDPSLNLLKTMAGDSLKTLSLDDHPDLIKHDLSCYLARMLEPSTEKPVLNAFLSDSSDIKEVLLESAEGNIGYLAFLAKAIDEAERQGNTEMMSALLTSENLPAGLPELFSIFLTRLQQHVGGRTFRWNDPTTGEQQILDQWSELFMRIFNLLAIAHEPLDNEQINTLASLQVTPEILEQTLERMRQFLDHTASGWRLYHSALADFLQNPILSKAHHCAPDWGHSRLVQAYKKQCFSNWSTMDDYGIRHLPTHAARIKSSLFAELVGDPNFWETKKSRAGLPNLLADLRLEARQPPPWDMDKAHHALLREAGRDDWNEVLQQLVVRFQRVNLHSLAEKARDILESHQPIKCTLRVLRAPYPENALRFQDHQSSPITALKCIPNRDLLLVGFEDGTVNGWHTDEIFHQVLHVVTNNGHVQAKLPPLDSLGAAKITELFPNNSGGIDRGFVQTRYMKKSLSSVTAFLPLPGQEKILILLADGVLIELDLSSSQLTYLFKTNLIHGKAALSPQGTRILVIGSRGEMGRGSLITQSPEWDCVASFWDLDGAEKIATYSVGHQLPIAAYTLDNENRALTSHQGGGVHIWDFNTCRIYDALQIAPPEGEEFRGGERIESMVGDKLGQILFFGTQSRKILHYVLASGTLTGSFESHRTWVDALHFEASHNHLFSGSGNGMLQVSQAKEGSTISSIQGHDHGICALASHSKNQWLFSGDKNGTFKVWDIDALKGFNLDQAHIDAVEHLALVNGGSELVSISRAHAIFWEFRNGTIQRERWIVPPERLGLKFLSCTTEGLLVAQCDHQPPVVWDCKKGKLIQPAKSYADMPQLSNSLPEIRPKSKLQSLFDRNHYLMEADPTGNYTFSAHRQNGCIKVWSCSKSKVLATWTHRKPPLAIALAEIDLLVVADTEGLVLYRLNISKPVLTIKMKLTAPVQMVFSPQSGQIFLSEGAGGFFLIDISTVSINRLSLDHEGVGCLALHPNDGLGATADSNGWVNIWDFSSGARFFSWQADHGVTAILLIEKSLILGFASGEIASFQVDGIDSRGRLP